MGRGLWPATQGHTAGILRFHSSPSSVASPESTSRSPGNGGQPRRRVQQGQLYTCALPSPLSYTPFPPGACACCTVFILSRTCTAAGVGEAMLLVLLELPGSGITVLNSALAHVLASPTPRGNAFAVTTEQACQAD